MAPLDIAPRNTDLDTALADARERYTAARPKSAAAHERAKAVMPGGNTRSTLFYSPFPTAMAGGQGCHLTDIDGHDYLDLCGGIHRRAVRPFRPAHHRGPAGGDRARIVARRGR